MYTEAFYTYVRGCSNYLGVVMYRVFSSKGNREALLTAYQDLTDVHSHGYQ